MFQDNQMVELDNLKEVGDGVFQFIFQRNRLSLEKASTLIQQGCELASSGRTADAMEKFQAAMEIDPHSPEPNYHLGMCLLELGAYAKARDAFDEVEQLAPGWFRCRFDRWIADGLDQGTIVEEQFAMVRLLEDGGLEKEKVYELARKGIEMYPDFAPLYYLCANACEDSDESLKLLEQALERCEERDLKSRVLSLLASRLPEGSPERQQCIEEAVGLKGSLMAIATAKLLGIRTE